MPFNYFAGNDCFFDYQIAHLRSDYISNYFDVEDSNDELREFFVTYEGKGHDLYFSVETYYSGMIPNQCISGVYNDIALSDPVLDLRLYNPRTSELYDYKIYSEQFNYPLMLTQSSEWDFYRLDVQYTWFNYPAKDYTVKLYSPE